MLTKFFFVRHGKTIYNKEKRYTGQLDIPLSIEYLDELIAILPKLKKQQIPVIYSSPMLRAKQTSQIIANYLNIPIIYVEEFRERSFGIFEGKKKFAYKKNYFHKGQSLYSYKRQVIRGLNKIKLSNNSLIVGHSGTYKSISYYYQGYYPKKSIFNARLISFELKKFQKWENVEI